MRIDELLARSRPVFSFEFSPPRTEAGTLNLFETIRNLQPLEPGFVSVTYGAGGSQRRHTVELVKQIRRDTSIEPMAHLTCVGADRDALRTVLDELTVAGIDNVLALRGDPPIGDETFTPSDAALAHGSDLTALVMQDYGFCIGGACYPEGHPESGDPLSDVAYTRLKVENGARFLITQMFFDNRHYFDYVMRARSAGITVPIIPGIMPITNVAQATRMTTKIGTVIPPALMAALDERRDDPEATLQLGVAWATLQCHELLAAGAPGIHFYTLNRSPATRAILSAVRAARPWERAA